MLCFDVSNPNPHFVNFSGGKDSTYMLLEMIRRNMPIDVVLNVDTGMEFPAMYDHINKVESFLWAERGMKITRLKAEKTFEELMFDAVKANDPDGTHGYGWPGAVIRWCTGQLKTTIVGQFCKSLSCDPYHYIALAADEEARMKRKNNQNPMHRHPLVEWGVTEAEALAKCYQAGYTWNGLYEHFSRVSCWCCPLQNLKELRTLRAYYPEIWTALRNLDDRAIAQFGWNCAYGKFRPRESVRMLEVRFDFEKEWAQAGGNIRSRAFYRELRYLYEKHFNLPPVSQNAAIDLLQYVTEEDLRQKAPEATDLRTERKKAKRKRSAFTR